MASRDFINKKVKIGVTGLNPHCESIDNLNEDLDIILPAIYDFNPSDLEARQFDMGMNYGLTFHVNRFIGISLETYQGLSEKNEQEFTNYGLKLSIGL